MSPSSVPSAGADQGAFDEAIRRVVGEDDPVEDRDRLVTLSVGRRYGGAATTGVR